MKYLMYYMFVIVLFTACSVNNSEDKRELLTQELDIRYGEHERHKMDVYFLETYDENTPVVFLLHGGGFIAGSKEEFEHVSALFKNKGYITVNMNYRLVDSTGLAEIPPAHLQSDIRVSNQVKDVELAVEKYKSLAEQWETTTTNMYMAGHSAGGTLAMLYVQGKNNSGVKASANFAGLTNITVPEKYYENEPDHEFWPNLKELLYRISGKEVIPENALSLMAISPNWVTNANKPGMPNITVMAASNDEDLRFAPFISTVDDADDYHHELLQLGTPSEYVLMDTDHGFGRHPDDWAKAVDYAVDFFNGI